MTDKQYTKAQIRAFKQQSTALEHKYQPLIERALNSQIDAFLDYAENMGLANALNNIDTLVLPKPIEDVLRRLYVTEGTRAGRLAESRIRTQYGQEFNQMFGKSHPALRTPVFKVKAMQFFTDWLSNLTDFFNYVGFQAVTRVTNTTRDWLRRQTSAAMNDGATLPEIRDMLRTDGISRSRANVIARTEVITALNHANHTAAEGSQLQFIKTWSTLRDKRVRHTHAHMEGETQDLEAPFSNGGMYPGDPDLKASERIQCRCTAPQIGKRDGNGRLMRK